MSSNDNSVKFKFRIYVGEDPERPYVLEKKGWFFWNSISRHRTLDLAKAEMMSVIQHENRKPGTVVFEYSDKDYLIDKLKGSA